MGSKIVLSPTHSRSWPEVVDSPRPMWLESRDRCGSLQPRLYHHRSRVPAPNGATEERHDPDAGDDTTMMKYVTSSLFDSPAQTLVNTVNTVGVMGKGIAAEFKKRYPAMFVRYAGFC